jgi:hypothetical protein
MHAADAAACMAALMQGISMWRRLCASCKRHSSSQADLLFSTTGHTWVRHAHLAVASAVVQQCWSGRGVRGWSCWRGR